MGSRHQIYVRLPAENKNPAKTIGITHHRGSDGAKMITLLANFIRLAESEDPKFNRAKRHDQAIGFLLTQYRRDPHTTEVYLNDETHNEDPRLAWNDEGITVIDLTGETIKFCLMSVKSMDCGGGSKDPTYGMIRHPNDPDLGQELYYVNFKPMTVTHFLQLHYGIDWKEGYLRIRGKQEAEDLQMLVKFLNTHSLLDVEELSKIFPKMVSEDLGKGIHLAANTLRFMDVVDKPIAISATSTHTGKIKSVVPRKKKPALGIRRIYA